MDDIRTTTGGTSTVSGHTTYNTGSTFNGDFHFLWSDSDQWTYLNGYAQVQPPPEEPRMKAAEKWLVVARENGAVVQRCESEADAIAEASRLASKHEDEYIVFKAVKRLRPKPDVETVEA